MKTKTTTKMLVLTALFTAITAVLAQIQLPIGPVPFSLAVFAVFMAGMLLPPLWACTSMFVYMFLGTIGVPVFANFQAGPAAMFGKTGGYVLGYFAIAACTSLAIKYSKKVVVIALAMLAGLVICYAFGTAWFMVITGSGLIASLGWCVFPFILPDIAKAVCAYLLGKALSKRLALAGLATN